MKIKSLVAVLALCVASNASANSYSTNFPLTENPISENGHWINGETVGLDWYNVQTINGHASGDQPFPDYNLYNDSTAVLTGSWSPNQSAQATVVGGNTYATDGEEVELRVCSSISAHTITGYEFTYRNYPNGGYCAIVRWNGPLNDFTTLATDNNNYHGVKSGDVVLGTIAGGVIRSYVNGVLVSQATDTTYTNGSPGVGFDFFAAPSNDQTNFGLTAFSAWDDGSPVPTPTPTPVPTPSPTPVPYIAWEAKLLGAMQAIGVSSSQITTIKKWLGANQPYP
jgi:hypothetical protein